MEKKTVVKHYGSGAKVGKALGLTRQAVSAWPEVIPEVYALRLEKLSGGALVYDENYYRSTV